MRVADRLAQLFAEHGFRHAFGIIGAGNIALYDAIARLGFTKIIAVHHEQAAAMAATYYWRTNGKLAPVLPTTGGGSANTLTGVIAAWMDAIPLLIVSGNEPSKYFLDGGRVIGVQGYRNHEIPWVKRGVRLEEPKDLEFELSFCLDCATSGRFGPVWLDIPRDIQNATL